MNNESNKLIKTFSGSLSPYAPKVSIGMPVYNGELYLREAIDSLLSQTFADFELIISDNASSDNTELICKEYASKDARIRYFRQLENRGPAVNFQIVLDQAIGEYFMWAAADDFWGSGFIRANCEFLDNNIDFIAAITNSSNEGVVSTLSGCYPIISDYYASRAKQFLILPGANCRFYSLYRIEILRCLRVCDFDFLGGDWAFVLELLRFGKYGQSSSSVEFFKRAGISRDPMRLLRYFSSSWIDFVIPYRRLCLTIMQSEVRPYLWRIVYCLQLNLGFVLVCIKTLLRKHIF